MPPGTGTHRPGAYHERAGLSILTHPDGTWTATDESGVDITSDLEAAVSLQSMYDARQAGGGEGDVTVTEIDVVALVESGRFPANGLIYAGTEGATTGTDCGGVRLKRGEELPGPLTVASENPVYVWGDYNTVDPKPAAVIGDAVNLLSNNWDDSKTSTSYPRAGHTTYNVAIVTGNQETIGSAYNGGL